MSTTQYGKRFKALCTILAWLCGLAILALFSPLAQLWLSPLPLALYWPLLALFWLGYLGKRVLATLQKNNSFKLTSTLDEHDQLKQTVQLPGWAQIREAAAQYFGQPKHLVLLILLILLFGLNQIFLSRRIVLGEIPAALFGLDAAGQLNLTNLWLFVCSAVVLIFCVVLMNQNYTLKESSKRSLVQNLIINAHSKIEVGDAQVQLVDADRMFLMTGKNEYFLSAQAPEGLQLAKQDAVLDFQIATSSPNDYPVTEFYLKQMTVFIDDLVISCDNYHLKFHSLFEEDHAFMLRFFIRFRDTDRLKLSKKLNESFSMRLYFNIVMRNSLGVITDLYGSSSYEKAAAPVENGAAYEVRENKINQYFYM